MQIVYYNRNETVIYKTQGCEIMEHIQQVAYSTYHKALTQICFTCNLIRTTMPKQENDL